MTPAGVEALTHAGHVVMVEDQAGTGSGFSNQEYEQAGAKLGTAEDTWSVDLVVKVKEPLESEYQYLKRQMVFTFFHLAGVAESLTDALLESGTTAIAYETLEDEQGRLPILAPMSAVAGNMAALMGSYYLAKFNQGKGMQLGKVLGKQYGKVVIIGDGVVGQHAAHVTSSMGAKVYMAGRHEKRGRHFKETILPDINYFISSEENIKEHLADVDLIVGAVLLRGAKAPYVVTEEMVRQLQQGTVIVDVSIDQGGCVETSRPTSHSDPIFVKHGIVHYCVTNMPGAYPRTSTLALMEATMPYLIKLANEGFDSFIAQEGLRKAVNTYNGFLTCQPVAEELGLEEKYRNIEQLK